MSLFSQISSSLNLSDPSNCSPRHICIIRNFQSFQLVFILDLFPYFSKKLSTPEINQKLCLNNYPAIEPGKSPDFKTEGKRVRTEINAVSGKLTLEQQNEMKETIKASPFVLKDGIKGIAGDTTASGKFSLYHS